MSRPPRIVRQAYAAIHKRCCRSALTQHIRTLFEKALKECVPLSFPQFLNAIRARRKLLFYTLLLTMVTVVGLSLALPASYKATATLVLSYKGVDPLNGVVLPAQLMPGYMATQAGVIASKSVAKKVVEDIVKAIE